jgi:hypothetical protein
MEADLAWLELSVPAKAADAFLKLVIKGGFFSSRMVDVLRLTAAKT